MLRMQCKKDGDGDDSFGGKRDQRMVHLDFFGLLGGFGLMTALLDFVNKLTNVMRSLLPATLT